ncbi:oxidoreductase [Aspergillus undulatus]|uniref:oxidoreductase n=1 Tax=Aspergillus undulatus TaxID=1810928 RepID=UPI003CCE0AD2
MGSISETDVPSSVQVDTPAKMHTHDLFNLRERTIIVTGGVGALGLETARAIMECGGDVIAIDCIESAPVAPWENLQKLAVSCSSKLWYYQCDITDPDHTNAVFQSAASQARYPLRGLVACAGICTLGPSVDFSIPEMKRIIDVNLVGTMVCAQAAARIIAKQHSDRPASMVFIASMSGYVVNRGLYSTAYNSSKAGVHQLTRNLASEYGGGNPDGFNAQGWTGPQIRVNSISPGYIKTRMTEPLLADPTQKGLMVGGSMLGRVSTPDEYRGPVIFLLSDASSYMTGGDLLVDGGHTRW